MSEPRTHLELTITLPDGRTITRRESIDLTKHPEWNHYGVMWLWLMKEAGNSLKDWTFTLYGTERPALYKNPTVTPE